MACLLAIGVAVVQTALRVLGVAAEAVEVVAKMRTALRAVLQAAAHSALSDVLRQGPTPFIPPIFLNVRPSKSQEGDS